MSRYNFQSLSSQDFEELTRDLLQAEWNVALEAFKTGRDGGIDLRYAPAGDGTIIIQCKHFVGSGFRKLLAHLVADELGKIQRLKPSRYVLVTSVALSPDNKNEIVRALHPFVLRANDVVGAGDLEGLLSRHPAVETSNFKLWLTSTSVIERVLHNAEVCQTEFEVSKIQSKVSLFVQSDAFPRAMQLLADSRIAVISGAPGIGKTTLAEMMLFTHLEQGYEPVAIQADIAEGKKFFRRDAKRIFYYDDFLGHFFLGDRGEYFGRNQDQALVDFIEMVQQSAHSRFVLTTREHLLQSALQLSERLARSKAMDSRYILELRDYSFGQKARILYNHLYFSGLPNAYKEAVLADDFFLKVIRHEHFSPRLIEWLSTELRRDEVSPSENYVSRLLESPHEIWMHAYRNQLSGSARHVLLSFFTLGEYTDIGDLEPAFRSLHRHCAEKYHQPIGPEDFRNALKELDGAFLKYSSGHASYLNPSIREFVASVIAGSREIIEDLLTSAIRFKQLDNLDGLAVADASSVLASYLAETPPPLNDPIQRLMFGPSIRWEKTRSGIRGYSIDMGEEARIDFLMQQTERRETKDLCNLITEATNRLIAKWDGHVPDFRAVLRLLEEASLYHYFLTTCDGVATCRRILLAMLDHLQFATAADWSDLWELPGQISGWMPDDRLQLDASFQKYCQIGVSREREECTTEDEMGTLVESLNELSTKTTKDFSYEIGLLTESIAEKEERESDSSERIIRTSAQTSDREATDDDVRQMFSTLRDRSAG